MDNKLEITVDNKLEIMRRLSILAADVQLIATVIERDGIGYLEGNIWLFQQSVDKLKELADITNTESL